MTKTRTYQKLADAAILKTPQFVDELPSKNVERSSKYVAALAPVAKRKGKWALIAEFPNTRGANGIASYLRANPASLPGKFEFAVRTLDKGIGGLYAKCVGK